MVASAPRQGFFVSFFLGLASLMLAQDADIVFRTETRIVEVTVIATDREGMPVADLTAQEMTVLDNGKEQEIESFLPVGSFVDARRGGQEFNAPARRALRHTVILVDALNTRFSDQAFARKALGDVFRNFVSTEDRVAVFVLSNQLKMLHDFTGDGVSLDVIGRALSGEGAAGDVRARTTDGESVDFTVDDIFSKPDRARSRVEADMLLQRRVLATLDALSAIAKGIAQIPGQKNLIWLSSAFPLQSWSSRINPVGGASSIGQSLNFNREAEQMTNELNSANVNLYPVDARGLSLDSRAQINIAVMAQLAEDTGGRAYVNRNDLSSAIRSAIDDSRMGYVLTYSPSSYGSDGTHHVIKVRTARRNVRLRYRPGYTASYSQPVDHQLQPSNE